MLKINSMLHPTDFSDSAKAAFEFACSLARDHGARIDILAVKPLPIVHAEAGVVVQVQESLQALEKELKENYPSVSGVELGYYVAQGNAVEEILRHAAEQQSDLIVMGTHGRTGLSRVIMGSVAEQVMRKAECPVLTLRHPDLSPESE